MLMKVGKLLFGGCIYILDSSVLVLPEDDADVLKRVAVLTIYKILLINIRYAFVGLDNKLYKMHGTYIKILTYFIAAFFFSRK